MTEEEILDSLYSYIYVMNGVEPLKNPFFKRCYDLCMANKDDMNDNLVWKIIEDTKKEFQLNKMKFMVMLKEYLY